MNLGMTEVIVILVVVLLLFGPSKLPSLGKSMGEAIRGFKKGLNTDDEKPAQVVREENHRIHQNDDASSSKQSEKKKETQG